MKRNLLFIFAIFATLSLNAQIFSVDFQDENISDWVTVTPTWESYNTKWHLNEHGGNYALRASCYDGSNHATEQWIISPSFSTENYTNISMEFKTEKNYNPFQDLELYVSTDFSGDSASFNNATWVQITGFELPTANEWTWFTSTADLSSVAGNASVYFAFKYVSTDAAGGVWDFDDVTISGSSDISKVQNNLHVFPNPASSELNIKSNAVIASANISNLIGQSIISIDNINASNYKIDLNGFANGVYFIKVNKTDGTSDIVKFVKK